MKLIHLNEAGEMKMWRTKDICGEIATFFTHHRAIVR